MLVLRTSRVSNKTGLVGSNAREEGQRKDMEKRGEKKKQHTHITAFGRPCVRLHTLSKKKTHDPSHQDMKVLEENKTCSIPYAIG